MRLGGPFVVDSQTPDGWVSRVRALGYRAAYCPVGLDASPEEIRAYAAAARTADIVIAEVGVWSNPLSPDESTRKAALAKCTAGLLLAERIGARCCVNIAGSRGATWDGPYAANLTEETFAMIVDSVRGIVDAVRPKRTFYTLETMPWVYPDSAHSYLDLIRAIDRACFAVHFDPVNLISSPERYFRNAELIREFVARLGPHIRSCHAKDILLQEHLTVHLDEVRPGRGALDYRSLLKELAGLDRDLPLMLEHLSGAEEYQAAASHVRQVAEEAGVTV